MIVSQLPNYLQQKTLGFAEKGDGGNFASQERGLRNNGDVTINSSGGLKSKGHPLGATGTGQVVEIFKQLRGDVEKGRQVDDAEVGLTHNVGGSGATCAVHIFGRFQMTNSTIFEGYFILHDDNGIIAKSRFIDGDIHAFDSDSDYTTTVSAVNKINITKDIREFAMDENIDADVMQASGYLSNKEAEWKIICHPKSAELCITKDSYWDYQFDGYSNRK